MNKIIIASGPVIVEDGKVLLNISGSDDFWKFCGGKVKEGESLEATALRRSKEEMGVDLEIVNQTPFLLYTIKQTSDGVVDIILAHFLAKRLNEVVPGEDIREWRWFSFEELDKEKLAPNIVPTLKHFGFVS